MPNTTLDPVASCPEWCTRGHHPYQPGVPGSEVVHTGPAHTIETAEYDGTVTIRRTALHDTDGRLLDEMLDLDITAWGERIRLPLHPDEAGRLARALTSFS